MNKEVKKSEKIEKTDERQILTQEQILEKAGREYYESGNENLNKERANSALVLFFKALLSFCDVYLLKKQGKSPSSHNDRFRTAERFFPEVYVLLDKDFPFYVDSYGKLVTKEQAEAIKYDAEIMAAKTGIKL